MLELLFHAFSRLPLPAIHAAGVVAGWMMRLSSQKFRQTARSNIRITNITSTSAASRRLMRLSTSETGKGLMETFAIWFRPAEQVLGWVKQVHGWEHVEAAHAAKRGIVFLTPHLGCYEITARYYAAHHPINVLFRPPRQPWLQRLTALGRNRGQMRQVPTTLGGIRELMRSLKRGEAIGVLPDQVPEKDEGVWARFFDYPAYTMTLASKLAQLPNVDTILVFGERLSWGRGFVLHLQPLTGDLSPQGINNAVEQLVRSKPEQYLWNYRRFKKP
ncbi:lysophospholipid acyltransferase family protein [Pseudomethylobacillus aquaticus]|uniref:Lysophospholipid acyltransferase family protein n=1 Tax=Pseudomethylobacillus aquaticus TaxID=2676064 RepID=A0A3N0UZQ6_9PROT|nr:lysophospholipid acyltransferase family protein [Pseudomethylobacillus aquaticus]ROH85925.1 lysophospholipid acyltransferase family protein [Pseudomethylobacillus aquaticus]